MRDLAGKKTKCQDADDEGLKARRGPPAIGSLVHGSNSEVFDLMRGGAVGILLKILQLDGRRHYKVGRTQSDYFGCFPYVRKITVKEAGEILRGAREQRQEAYSKDYEGTMGDAIRKFLREEAQLRRAAAAHDGQIDPNRALP